MASEASMQPSPDGRSPWWVAAAGGGGSVMAAVMQHPALAWVIVIGFTAWLAHNIVITWITKKDQASDRR